MNKKVLSLLIILILLSLPSCSSGSSSANGESNLTIVNLQVTPALAHWLPAVASCADPIPDFGVSTQIVSPEALSLDDADVILRLGDQQENDPYAAVMGVEEIVIVAGLDLPLSSLSVETLRAIYTGSYVSWDMVPEINAAGIETDQPIQPLSYPDGHELRRLFVASYLNAGSLSGDITVFSTLDRLQTLLTEQPFSIAYVLESQLPKEFISLTITGADPLSAGYYVLAVAREEPEGELKQLLLCLQNSQ